MEQKKVTINLPSEILSMIARKREDIPSRVLEYLILELYRLGELSSGKAAQYLNMERFEFIRFASRMGIAFIDMDEEELSEDYRQATRVAEKTTK